MCYAQFVHMVCLVNNEDIYQFIGASVCLIDCGYCLNVHLTLECRGIDICWWGVHSIKHATSLWYYYTLPPPDSLDPFLLHDDIFF